MDSKGKVWVNDFPERDFPPIKARDFTGGIKMPDGSVQHMAWFVTDVVDITNDDSNIGRIALGGGGAWITIWRKDSNGETKECYIPPWILWNAACEFLNEPQLAVDPEPYENPLRTPPQTEEPEEEPEPVVEVEHPKTVPDFNTDEIDYRGGHSMHGGNLADIPEPHIRKFPNPFEKRTLTIHVMRYAGFKHYFCSLAEEDNPLWNSEEKCWQRAWDDDDAEGDSTHSPELNSYQEALAWIDATIEKNYVKDDWNIVVDDYSDVGFNWLIKYQKGE